MSEQTVWGIHAGKTGDAEALFAEQGVIAIGWPNLGDLSALTQNRETYKARYAEAYPEASAGNVPVGAGQLFRFLQEIKPDDLVIFPAKLDRTVRIGRVKGGYTYRPDISAAYPNQRPVEWLKTFPRTKFSQAALYEIGSALSLFQVKNFADEFRAALSGIAVAAPVSEDSEVAAVVQESQQGTEDFILKRLAHEFKGHAFENFVAHLLEAMGFRARVTKKSGDGGIDIIAHKDALGLEPPIIKVQVKSGEGSVGEPEVKQLKGNLSGGEKGLLVTLGTISTKAELFARTVPDIRLIDGEGLVKLILENYEQFDSRYRAAVPLKRVYLPAPPQEGD